jgi:hypothetical protein
VILPEQNQRLDQRVREKISFLEEKAIALGRLFDEFF